MRLNVIITLALALIPPAAQADEPLAALKVDSEVYSNASDLASANPVRTDEKLAVLRAGSETYSNVTVTTVSATDVFFTYAGGMGNVKIKNLSPDLQQHFNFDPDKAKVVEIKQAEDRLKYHEELLHEPVVKPPDMSRDSAATTSDPVWRRDLITLLQEARSQNKMMLLDFTASDWSPWCVKFDQEVLGSAKFTDYAGQKLVIVRADFPRNIPQADDLKQANNGLADFFKVTNFPTFVLLNASGRELGRQVGYLPGGPDIFINELESFSRH